MDPAEPSPTEQVDSKIPPKPARVGLISRFQHSIRTRIIGGLILALPIAITWWIVLQLYLTLQSLVIQPVTWIIRHIVGPENLKDLPGWWQDIVAPFVAISCVLVLLYFLGLLVSTSLARALDWIMTRLPFVTTIYQAVRKVFQSLAGGAGGGSKFKRVVSVPYPSESVRVPGFVMKSMRDVQTGRTILSIFVPFSPVPTSGFLLLVPEEDVIDIGWSVNDTMQGVLSGGLTLPDNVRYHAVSKNETVRKPL